MLGRSKHDWMFLNLTQFLSPNLERGDR
jgi:hypothetical protein